MCQLNLFTKDSEILYLQIGSYNDFWNWTEKLLLPELYPSPWYPGVPSTEERVKKFPGKLFLNDLTSKIVNGVRLRQLRVKPGKFIGKSKLVY